MRTQPFKASNLPIRGSRVSIPGETAAINNLSLERSLPKAKSKSIQSTISAKQPVFNPPTDGLGGKAGKTKFVILVGETENLYKTPKLLRVHCYSTKAEIDLHGCTREEAVKRLDDSLPQWIEMAMEGTHPWVISVLIVCGGGNQILSQAVECWIRKKDQVANAPKD